MHSLINGRICFVGRDAMLLAVTIRLSKDFIESGPGLSLGFGRGLPIGPQNNEKDPVFRLKRPPDDRLDSQSLILRQVRRIAERGCFHNQSLPRAKLRGKGCRPRSACSSSL